MPGHCTATRLCALLWQLRQANRYVQHVLPSTALYSSHTFAMTAPSNVDQSVFPNMVYLRLLLGSNCDRSTSQGMLCVPDISVYSFLLVGLQMTHVPISCCLTCQLNKLTEPKSLGEHVPVANFRYPGIFSALSLTLRFVFSRFCVCKTRNDREAPLLLAEVPRSVRIRALAAHEIAKTTGGYAM